MKSSKAAPAAPAQKLEDLYDISRVLGRGAFSTVYFATHRKKREHVAIKIEDGSAASSDAVDTAAPPLGSLKHECKILLYLSGGDGVPRVRWFEIRDAISFLVMDYYKYSLVDTIAPPSSGGRDKLRKKDKIDIFKQAFYILKYIHTKFIIHRDIKPANIMLKRRPLSSDGSDDGDDSDEESVDDDDDTRYEVFIIDFGMAKVYVDEDKEHMEERTTNEIIGTPKFVSLFVHDHIEPARRDDFISLGYVLLYMFHGLTWYNQPMDRIATLKRAHYLQESTTTQKNTIFQFITEYLKNCYLIEFKDTYRAPMILPTTGGTVSTDPTSVL